MAKAPKSAISIAKGNRIERGVPYLFITPFLISFIIFFLVPAVYSLILSFYQFKGYGAMKFKGFGNYVSLLTYNTFWASMGNTVFYFVAHIIPTMILAFLFAFILQTKLMKPVQSFFKPILFMPQIIPIVATSLIFRIMYQTQYGAINQIMGTQINFLGEAAYSRWAVVIMMIWRSMGWYMVIFMAGLTTVSDDIIEAGTIDGANVTQRIFHITLPMMRPIFLFAFVMGAISSLKIFTEPNVLLADSSGLATRPNVIPVMNILKINLSGGNFGMASAAGWLIFLFVLAVSAVQFRIMGRED